MKNQFILLLIILTKVSYASFPVLDKINEPDLSNFLIFGLAIILSVLGFIYNKRKYGTYYNPNKKQEVWLWKYKWIVLLFILVISIIAMGASSD